MRTFGNKTNAVVEAEHLRRCADNGSERDVFRKSEVMGDRRFMHQVSGDDSRMVGLKPYFSINLLENDNATCLHDYINTFVRQNPWRELGVAVCLALVPRCTHGQVKTKSEGAHAHLANVENIAMAGTFSEGKPYP